MAEDLKIDRCAEGNSSQTVALAIGYSMNWSGILTRLRRT